MVLAKQRQHIIPKYHAVGVFNNLICRISSKTMDMIWLQYRLAWIDYKANDKTGNAYTGCTRGFNYNTFNINLTLSYNPNLPVANVYYKKAFTAQLSRAHLYAEESRSIGCY